MRLDRVTLPFRRSLWSVALAFLSIQVFGQGSSTTSGDWVRLVAHKNDFSFSLPADGWVVHKKEGETSLYRSTDGTSISITIGKRSGAKKDFRRWASTTWSGSEHKLAEVGNHLVMQKSGSPGIERRGPYTWLFIASEHGTYSMAVSGKETQQDFYRGILNSVQLEGTSLFASPDDIGSVQRKVDYETLRTDPLIELALKVPDSRQEKLLRSNVIVKSALPLDLDAPAGSDRDRDYSRDLILVKREKAEYTASARDKRVTGTVTLSVTFQGSGQIGTIELLRSLDRGLDNAAFKVAKRIKFLPALVNGQPVDVTRSVSYTFGIY